MPYKDDLKRWVVVRLLANMQRVTVAKFRSRADADGYLQIIRRLQPHSQFMVMFNADLKPELEAELQA
ncbi:hypothetical protein NIES4074_03210 [Cylindrospermum sp. NIES-4074]|jgi:hypothetical protein|nr:hypothetical protein NIES4074_03210 [Cylindrospermum sp. NIES-4074]